MEDPIVNSIETRLRLEPTEIEAQFMTAAIRMWLDYFWPHARGALRQIGCTERHTLERRTLRWIRAQKHPEISLKQIRRQALSQAIDEEETQEILSDLVRRGWLKRKATQPTGGPGRPAIRWMVNPALWTEEEQ
jgi:hypothetical protein